MILLLTLALGLIVGCNDEDAVSTNASKTSDALIENYGGFFYFYSDEWILRGRETPGVNVSANGDNISITIGNDTYLGRDLVQLEDGIGFSVDSLVMSDGYVRYGANRIIKEGNSYAGFFETEDSKLSVQFTSKSPEGYSGQNYAFSGNKD